MYSQFLIQLSLLVIFFVLICTLFQTLQYQQSNFIDYTNFNMIKPELNSILKKVSNKLSHKLQTPSNTSKFADVSLLRPNGIKPLETFL